ncbi:MAG TPA: helix-turn-helix domain-containing protein [Jiangellaceae bacterium]
MERTQSGEGLERLAALASESFVPLQLRPVDDAPVRAQFQGGSVNGLVVARITAAPLAVERSRRLISSTDPEMLKVTLHLGGRAGVEQDRRHASLRPGDLVVYDTRRPYRLRYEEAFDTIVVGVPRGRLGSQGPLIERRNLTAMPADAGVRTLMAAFLTGVANTLDTMSDGAGMHLADAMVSLIVSAFCDVPSGQPESVSSLGDRILAYCLASLADPGLSVTSVARLHGVSVRYVHKVFSQRDLSLAAWIRRERLLRIRRDLADPDLLNRSTADIAARWGVLDVTHLGRALKASFGTSVLDLRRQALDAAVGRAGPVAPHPLRA